MKRKSSFHCTRNYLRALRLLVITAILFSPACRRTTPTVTVYTALDRAFSEPILKKFETDTGIHVRVKYDTEASKTIGLVNAIRSERARPRCDVFWNNEIIQTLRLKTEKLLAPYRHPAATKRPAIYRDPQGYWIGFAARARILLMNTKLVTPDQMPRSIHDLHNPRWRGKIGMAKPLFGTTATQAACLYALWGKAQTELFFNQLKNNKIHIFSGNRTVARAVAEGKIAFGLTDTDDAMAEIHVGSPVQIVYPDTGAKDCGLLLIPNTLSLIRNAPHPQAAKKLMTYLLSPAVEAELARGPSAQIPLSPACRERSPASPPSIARLMPVDFAAAAKAFPETARLLSRLFLE